MSKTNHKMYEKKKEKVICSDCIIATVLSLWIRSPNAAGIVQLYLASQGALGGEESTTASVSNKSSKQPSGHTIQAASHLLLHKKCM